MTGATRAALVRVDQCAVHPHNVRRDLGDLRALIASIERFGVIQPIVVEHHGDCLRLRAGHRRLAAAQIAGLDRIPAIVHSQALDTDEWLVHAVQENVMRRDLDRAERRDVIEAMRGEHMTPAGIADAFGVSVRTIATWLREPTGEPPRDRRSAGRTAVGRPALRSLATHLETLVDAGARASEVAAVVRSYAETLQISDATTELLAS